MFFTFRGLGGLASAISVPAAVGALGAIYKQPSPRKNKAFACFSAGNPLGFVVGSIMSGVATQKAGWRAPFYVLSVVYAAFAVLCWLVVPDDENPIEWGMWRSMDWTGAVMVTVGLVGVCAALT